jgi:SAM-dependent methyltransferase
MKPSWNEYYKKVITLPHRPMTVEAVNLIVDKDSLVAIDCGCGTGRDIAYLENIGFSVHAFDIEERALEVCNARFCNNPLVIITKSSFADFDYPDANLVIANSSLFFCPETEFKVSWSKITDSLSAGGVFCSDFLGSTDSWVKSPAHEVTAFTRDEVMGLLTEFDIISFFERDEDGKTALGREKHWHTYSVIAVKSN